MDKTKILYFGCYRTAGHYLYGPNGENLKTSVTPWGKAVDCGLCVKQKSRNRARTDFTRPDGETFYHVKDGWSAVAFWDRSGDSRPNSCSVFILPDVVDEETLVDMARVQWPQLLSRAKAGNPGYLYSFPVLRVGGNVTEAHVGQNVRYHPIIGGEHDGKLYELLRIEEASSGDTVCFIKGKSGYVAIEALSKTKHVLE